MKNLLQAVAVRKFSSIRKYSGPAVSAFLADRSGAAAVTVALTFSLMVGFAGLATEVGQWYVAKRTMQGAADSAAYSAATAKASGGSSAIFTSEAKTITSGYGYADGTGNVVVTVNNPPTSGVHVGNANAVEVVISRPQPIVLASMFMGSQLTLEARAVANIKTSGTGCVLALDRGNVTDVKDNGNTAVNLNSCSLYVNSPSTSALSLVGGATINAYSAFIAGNYTTTGSNSALTTTNGTFTGAAAANDPYADAPIPPYSGCNQNNYSLTAGQSKTFSPGSSGIMVFCNGLSLTGGSNLILQAGTYIIDGGDFSMAGNSTISGTGVTLILTSSSGSNYGSVSISGGSVVNLTAPTSGQTAGIAVYQDRNAPQKANTNANSFTGGATQNIVGAIYLPNQGVTFNGGTQTAKCTQLVALTISFNGNAQLNINCSGVGVRGIGNSLIALVE